MADSAYDVPDLSGRTDFIPKEGYLSREFLRLEKERLWPRVWLIACREEDLNQTGKFVTFDIADESIILTRDTEGRIQAFFNVCPHRGRRVTNGCGKANGFYCNYHGWQWHLDGTNKVMINGDEWTGIGPDDVGLRRVRHESWGGFIFVNIDGQAEPLLEFLHPWPEMWKSYRIEDMRYRWFKTTHLNCNWKVALEAFLEGYHGQTTHRQIINSDGGSLFTCSLFGRHGAFYNDKSGPLGSVNPNLKFLPPIDTWRFEGVTDNRVRFYRHMEMLNQDLDCLVSSKMVEAAKRLIERVPADASNEQMGAALVALHREIAAREGVDLSHLPNADMAKLGQTWSLFPNMSILPTLDGLLIYRARPDGDDPDKCFLDVFPLERFAPGMAPPITRQFFEKWQDGNYPRIFVQDFDNVERVQRGMKSRGFRGAHPNPKAEKVVWNFERHLRAIVLGE